MDSRGRLQIKFNRSEASMLEMLVAHLDVGEGTALKELLRRWYYEFTRDVAKGDGATKEGNGG